METALVLKFIRHLQQCTADVMGKVEIERYDIAALRRELLQMQHHIDGREGVNPRILAGILELKLQVDESLLSDSSPSTGWFIFSTLFRHSFLHSRREVRLEKLKLQLKAFQEDLDHLRFALDR